MGIDTDYFDRISYAEQCLREKNSSFELKKTQKRVIERILCAEGKYDVLTILPTGFGKSICFQIPALLLPGITIVVSPLLALIENQVKGFNDNRAFQKICPECKAVSFTGLTTKEEKEQYAGCKDEIKMIYTTPESLQGVRFQQYLRGVQVSMLVVDEAHCVSFWGIDFRPSYRKIKYFVDEQRKHNNQFIVSAFTATAATPQIRKDIIRLLDIRMKVKDTVEATKGELLEEKKSKPRREEIRLYNKTEEKEKDLLACIGNHMGEEDRGIIFCLTKAQVERVCVLLEEYLKSESGSVKFKYYKYYSDSSASKNDAKRKEASQKIQNIVRGFNTTRDSVAKIIVATSAFGMGIDFEVNVSYVINYSLTLSLEDYYQQIGRAGRKATGQMTYNYLLCSAFHDEKRKYKSDIDIAEGMTNVTNVFFLKKSVAQEVMRKKEKDLCDMMSYCLQHATYIANGVERDIARKMDRLKVGKTYACPDSLVINNAVRSVGKIDIYEDVVTNKGLRHSNVEKSIFFYDSIVADAVFSIWRDGDKTFSLAKILHKMTGRKIVNVSPERVKKMRESLLVLQKTGCLPITVKEHDNGEINRDKRVSYEFTPEAYKEGFADGFHLMFEAACMNSPEFPHVFEIDLTDEKNLLQIMCRDRRNNRKSSKETYITDNIIMINYYLLKHIRYQESVENGKLIFYYGDHHTPGYRGVFAILGMENMEERFEKGNLLLGTYEPTQIKSAMEKLLCAMKNLQEEGYLGQIAPVHKEYTKKDKRNAVEFYVPEFGCMTRGVEYKSGVKMIATPTGDVLQK